MLGIFERYVGRRPKISGGQLPVSPVYGGGSYRGSGDMVGGGERVDDAWLLDAWTGRGLLGVVSLCGSCMGDRPFSRLDCQSVQKSVPSRCQSSTFILFAGRGSRLVRGLGHATKIAHGISR